MIKSERVKKRIVILVTVLAFGVIGAFQAQAAWTSKETNRIKSLENKVKELESLINEKSANYEMKSIRFLAVGGSGGTYNDICPGAENLEGGTGSAYIGRLAPKTDGLGGVVTGLSGEPITYAVYRCKISFWVPKL
jgi:hypothetical protein